MGYNRAMKTLNWNDPTLRSGPLKKPVCVYQPRGWNGFSQYYTAVPMDLLDSIRAMLRAKGIKYRTFYVGHRPPDTWYDERMISQGKMLTHSITSQMTRRAHARYAKILCEDPITREKRYL